MPAASPSKARNPFAHATFLKSAPEIGHLPLDVGAEIAFAGRSNSGKSSALNAICAQKSLARVSKTPGRTQQLVIFTLSEQHRLVDLPGYGYAKVPHEMREHWGDVLMQYFHNRGSLRGLALTMDVRHPMGPFDQQMLALAQRGNHRCHVLLTKSDKLSRGAAQTTLHSVRHTLAQIDPKHSVQLFSALKGDGIDAARSTLAAWLDAPDQP
ncbi:MAG: ribosome biogenesis GTP-binding protein YihA/YsxC [Lysobacterales bacterium]